MTRIRSFVRHNPVLCIAALLAAVSCVLVPPDKTYLTYFDWRTLSCLFLTLAVVCALRDIMFFSILARRLVRLAGNLRSLTLLLIVITFTGSMLIANDMALITFLPLGYLALSVSGNEQYSAFVFILQNIAANLGGMLTPFGNPQNLYLYSYFEIPTGEFMRIMLRPFLLAIFMLAVCCLFLPRSKLEIREADPKPLDKTRTALYLVLFALSILTVFRLIPYWATLIVVFLALLILDREALRAVDYPLLGTFFLFFLFSGNLSRVEAVADLLGGLLGKDPLLVSVLSCQFISNVPSAILLSRFTDQYPALLLGVNIGGTGTLIASLASLITFSEYRTLYPGRSQTKKYLGLFLLLNAVFLVVLTVVSRLFFL